MSLERALRGLRSALSGLSAYQPEPDHGEAALDANESPFAPPAGFMADAAEAAKGLQLNRYPDPAAKRLRAAAAAHYQVPGERLLFGNGSDEFLALLLAAFGGENARLLVPSPTFSMYALQAKVAGWQVLEEPLDGDFQLSPAFFERAERDRPKLIFLASPNNPTGNCFLPKDIERLLQLEDVLLVLDEAYAEFSGQGWLARAGDPPNLVVLRTLSKAFGLAGLRVGALAAHPRLVAELDKARLPYNLGALPQIYAALALERAADFLPALERIRDGKKQLEKALRALPGARVWPSDANFFLFKHPEAGRLHGALLAQGLRLRRFSGGALEGCLRVSVGDPEQNERLFKALREFS